MNEKNKAKFKKLLTGAAALVTTCALVIAPACSNQETTEDEEEENASTRLDTQLIKNGNFEFYDDNDGTYFISTPNNWTMDDKGSESSSMSGIIDTSKARWDYMTEEITPEILEENDDLESDDENKVDYNGALTEDLPYKNPHDATASGAEDEDKEYISNPFTHSYSYDEEGNVVDAEGNAVTTYEDEDGNVYLDEEHTQPLETSVLMIHNYRKGYFTGTETYYKASTSVTLEASTAAELSVWVKTSDLYFDGSTGTRTPVNGETGAYIQVDTTVGDNSLDSFKIKYINTEKLNPDGENNGWVKYTVYIEASSFAETDVTVTLGLGDDDRNAPAEGYAFFDDLTMTKYKNGALMREAVEEGNSDGYFDGLVENSTYLPLDTDNTSSFYVSKDTTQTNGDNGEVETIVDDRNFEDRYFFIDLASYSVRNGIPFAKANVSAGLTVEKTNTGSYVSSHNTGYAKSGITDLNNTTGALNAFLPSKLTGKGLETKDDLLATLSITDAEDWKMALGGAYADQLTTALKSAATLPGVEAGSTDALVMLSANGAAYQAEITDDSFTLGADEYALVSFWLKTSDMNGSTAATVTVKDVNDENNTSNFTLDSTDIATVTINDEEDIYDGWVQCFIRVANNTEEESTYKVVVNFGQTTIQGTTNSSYTAGWLALANMSVTALDKDVYDYTSSISHQATLSLSESSDLSDFFFDDEQGDKNIIAEDVAIPETYTGVNGASAEVVNLGTDKGEYDDTNKNASAGLINRDHLDAYKDRTWFSAFKAFENMTNDEMWNAIAGRYSVQPLLIVNTIREFADKTAAVYNYGYISEGRTASASGYIAISVKVKVSKGAVANIYLTNSDPASKQVLSYDVPDYTFWYDNDGNALKGEPEEGATVTELRENIAYRLRNDGLYERYDGSDDKLYANFYNLEKYYDSEFEHSDFYDENGNKVRFDDLVQGETYYADAAKSAYAPHYLIAGSNTEKIYKYNAGLGDDATYLYMVDGVADEEKVVHGFDKDFATPRYDNSNASVNPYQFTIDAREGAENADLYADKWVTVTFYIHGGSETRDYKLEMWSGFRDEETSGQTENSYVLFDKSSITVDETVFSGLVSQYTSAIIDDYKSKISTQLPDNDGTIADYEQLAGSKSDLYNYQATYYTYSLYDSPTFVPFNAETAAEGSTGYAYSYGDYAETLGFLKIEDTTSDELTMSAFIDYSVLDKSIELSVTDDTEDDTTEEETTEGTTSNIGLLAASIAIVVAILIAIISIITRDLIKRYRRKHNAAGSNSFSFKKNKTYVKKYVKANGETPEVKEEDVDKTLLKDAETTEPATQPAEETATQPASDEQESVTNGDSADGTTAGEENAAESQTSSDEDKKD